MTETASFRARLRRFASRLTGRDDFERLAVLERALRRSAEAQQLHSAGLQSVQSKLADLADRSAKQASNETEALREVRDAVRKLGDRIAKHEDPLFAEGRRYLRRELEKTAAGSGPIIIGPWTGEVGFELLYWIPFVRWACAEFGIDSQRVIVISRGGVASWYGVPQDQYADVFGIIEPEQFRAATTAERPSQKQRERDALDDRILEAVTRQRGCSNAKVLHPGMMFRAFKQFFDDEVGYERLDEFTRPALLEPPVASRPGLPSDYIAVRFYFRRSFPDTPAIRAFAEAVVRNLARTVPVVVLTSGVRVDDHHDWTPRNAAEAFRQTGAGDSRGVTVFGDAPADRNLEVQSAIVGGARAFVGTFGGLSHLAPLYGIPSVGFYSRHAFEAHHQYVAERTFERIGAGHLTTVDVSQADLVGSALQPLAGAAFRNGGA